MNGSDLDSDSGISTIPRTATSLRKAQELRNAQEIGTQTGITMKIQTTKYKEEDLNDDAFVDEEEEESEQELKSIGRAKPFVRRDTFDIFEKAKLKKKMDNGRRIPESDDESKIKFLIPSSSDRSSPESYSHRKSVSFDLSGDERTKSDIERSYSPDTVGRHFFYDSEQEYNSSLDSRKGRDRGLKGILRSSSPSTASEKPRFMTANRISESEFENYSISDPTEPKINSDDEIERENPFREAFLSSQKIELDDEIKKLSINRRGNRDNFVIGKQIPVHALSKSNEDLYNPVKIPLRKPLHLSTGNLTEQAKRKPPPPIPPKPKIKQANVVRNVALTQLQKDLQHGDFIQYEHNIETNTIREVPAERPSSFFSPDNPLPPVPDKITSRKLNARPMDSPPPPPVNLATLPSMDEIPKSENDPIIVEIVPAKFHTLPTAKRAEFVHENSPDNVLVTEEVHRNVLLQENEIRNLIKETTEANPVNSPTLGSTTNSNVQQMSNPVTTPNFSMLTEQQQQNQAKGLPQSLPTAATSVPILSPTHIFPPPQILPVQYTHLPTPQQPGGYYQLAQQQNLPPPPPPNFVQLGYSTVGYTIPTQHYAGYNTFVSPPASAKTPKTVSDKKKFFESAMEEQHKPAPKSEKVFSFLSKDEVEKLKQEEERKIATLKNDKKNRLREGVGGGVGVALRDDDDDDNEYDDDDDDAVRRDADDDEDNVDNDVGGSGDRNANDNNDDDYHSDKEDTTRRLDRDDYENDNRGEQQENGDSRHISSPHSMIPTYVQRHVKKPQPPVRTSSAKPSPPPKSPALAMFATESGSRIPIRTANAEKRAKERESSARSPIDRSAIPERILSPLEIEARKAEKRAAWRQARLKSLEQDAKRAQEMIQSMNRMTDDMIDENKKEVETCQEKIISLELQDPEKDESPTSHEGDVDDDAASIVTIRPNPDKLFLTQDYSATDGSGYGTDKSGTKLRNNEMDQNRMNSLDPGGHIAKTVSLASLTQPPPSLRTIVEVVNPAITGDGCPNKIAIGRSPDCPYPSFDDYSYSHHETTLYSYENTHHKDIDENNPQNDSQNEQEDEDEDDDVDEDEDERDEYDGERINPGYGSTRRKYGERELSLNDKMKNVLQELLENERVKLNLSRSLIENDSSNPEEEDEEDNDDDDGFYGGGNVCYQDVDCKLQMGGRMQTEQKDLKSNGNHHHASEMAFDSDYLQGSSPISSYQSEKEGNILPHRTDMHSASSEGHVFLVDGCRVYRNPNSEISFGDDDDDGVGNMKRQTTTTFTSTNNKGSTKTVTTTRTTVNDFSGATILESPLARAMEGNRAFNEKLIPQMLQKELVSVSDELEESLQSQILHHMMISGGDGNDDGKVNNGRRVGGTSQDTRHQHHPSGAGEMDIRVVIAADEAEYAGQDYVKAQDIDIDQDTMNAAKIITSRTKDAVSDDSGKIIATSTIETVVTRTMDDLLHPAHEMITTKTTTVSTADPGECQVVNQQQQQQPTNNNQSSSTTQVATTTKKKKRKPKNKKK